MVQVIVLFMWLYIVCIVYSFICMYVMEPRWCHVENNYWAALIRAHDLVIRAHGLVIRAHELLIRAHGLVIRAHGLVIRAHGLVIRAHGLA